MRAHMSCMFVRQIQHDWLLHSKESCFFNPGSLKDTSAIVLRDILLHKSLFSPAFFTRKSSSNSSFVAFSYTYVHTCIYIPSCTFLHNVFTRQQKMLSKEILCLPASCVFELITQQCTASKRRRAPRYREAPAKQNQMQITRNTNVFNTYIYRAPLVSLCNIA